MLRQNCNEAMPAGCPGKADRGLVRQDHILFLVMDAGLAAYAAVRRGLESWRSRQALAELDERQLRDIGVTRAQALHESRRWLPGHDRSRRALAELGDSQLCNLSESGLRIRREVRRAMADHARTHSGVNS
jgi:uncharacterized protein YjiS (DUF1127 family)